MYVLFNFVPRKLIKIYPFSFYFPGTRILVHISFSSTWTISRQKFYG